MLPPFKRKLLPYAIVVLLAYIGFSLPLPIFPAMFLDPVLSILPQSFSLYKKTMLLGLIMTSYPLGQLIGSPILGRLSDRFGRKKVILYTLCGSTLGWVITAISTSHTFLTGIFGGLLICGFFEGNIAIAQAVIADITQDDHPNDKIFHFGWISLFVCLGFIIGPFLGGILADPSLVSWFTFATPFWIAALLTVAGIGTIYFGSEETRKISHIPKEPFVKEQLALLKQKPLRLLFYANFFISLAAFSFFRFFPVYLERVFSFTSSQLAYVMVFNSVIFALCLITFGTRLSKRLTPSLSTIIFTPMLGLVFIIAVLPSSVYSIIITVPIIGALLALTLTNSSVIVSNAARPESQGQVMGTLTSVQVMAELITAVVGAAFAAILPSLAIVFGGVMAFIGAAILYVKRRRHL